MSVKALTETFYRHFFDDDPKARDAAAYDLDEEFARLAQEGVGRYEITRLMICGIVNAQERFDAEEPHKRPAGQGAKSGVRSSASAGPEYDPTRPFTASSRRPAASTTARSDPFRFVLFAMFLLILVVGWISASRIWF